MAHIHVPKCAGSTVEAHLKACLGERYLTAPARGRKAVLAYSGRKYDQRKLAAERTKLDAISGHFIGRSIATVLSDRPLVTTLILRDPIDLMLSWVNFRNMRYVSQGRGAIPLEVALRALPDEPTSKFLLERWCEVPWPILATLSRDRKRAMLDEALGDVDTIVDISEADQLVRSMGDLLDIAAKAQRENTSQQWMAQTGWRPIMRDQLDDRLVADLSSRTQLDSYIWRRWALKQDIAFEPRPARPFLVSESTRAVAQLQRRWHRSKTA